MPRRGTLIAYVRRTGNTMLTPASWEAIAEDAGWSTVYPLGRDGASEIGGQSRAHRDVYFHARLMVAHPSLPRGLYVCVGHPWVLSRLADAIAADGLAWTRTWSSLAALRSDVSALAAELRASWPAEHIEGGGVRLRARMAGHLDDDAEEP